MDPVSLIVAALAAGAAAGAQNLTTDAVKDAYTSLKRLVGRQLTGRPAGEVALARHEEKPEQWRAALEDELTEAGAGSDSELIEAAKRVLAANDPDGARAGKYQVDLRGSQGVQVGDHGSQHNTFGGGPTPTQ